MLPDLSNSSLSDLALRLQQLDVAIGEARQFARGSAGRCQRPSPEEDLAALVQAQQATVRELSRRAAEVEAVLRWHRRDGERPAA